jgi:predicted Ser/Thr protein kinase
MSQWNSVRLDTPRLPSVLAENDTMNADRSSSEDKPARPKRPEEEATAAPRGGDPWTTREPRGQAHEDETVPPSAGASFAGLPEQLPADFGRYRVLKLLGKGGMGAVYLAQDSQLDRPVALKVPNFGPEDAPALKERFFREARAAATLLHPNICPVHDVGEIDGTYYLTMAFIDGKPLADLVGPNLKPQPPKQVALLVRKLALALAEAHRHKIIHRDLKPANIMINRQSEPVIMDFGLARRGTAKDARLTQLGAIMGTPAYMAPEQARGHSEDIGTGCDIYSLGVILYELLAGQVPFTGDTMAVLSQVLCDKPKPPSAWRKDVDPQLEAICLKAMAKRPTDRYASMDEFAAALSDFVKATASSRSREVLALPAVLAVEPAPVEVVPRREKAPRPKPPRRRRDGGIPGWVWGVGGAAAALLLAGGLFLVIALGGRKAEPPPHDPSASPPRAATDDSKQPRDPLKKPTGIARISLSEPNADVQIRIDGKLYPTADAVAGVSLEAGEHRLLVSGRTYQAVPPSTFTVKADDSTTVDVSLKQLNWATVWTNKNVREGKVLAPDLGRLLPRFQQDFVAFPPSQSADKNVRFDNGLLSIKNAGSHVLPLNGTASHYACEVVGRATGGSTWMLQLLRRDGLGPPQGSLAIGLGSKGDITIFGPSKSPKEIPPILLATTHPAIHKGDAFNTLLVIVRQRQVEVYVNQRAVCEPLTLTRDVAPGQLTVYRVPGGDGAVEFRQATFWYWSKLSDVPPLTERQLAVDREPPPSLAWPAKALAAGEIKAPTLDRPAVLPAFNLAILKKPFTVGTFSDGSTCAEKAGRYQVKLPKAMRHETPLMWGRTEAGPLNDFACELVGTAGGRSGQWGLTIASPPGAAAPYRVTLMVRNDGHLLVEKGRDDATLKRLPALAHSAIRAGPRASNTLLAVVRGRTVEVYVNKVAVCDPISLEEEIASPTFALQSGEDDDKGGLVEFERLTFWRADGLPTPADRGAVKN